MKVRSGLGIGLALAAALVTSACAAGQHAQTADERATLDGTYATLGPIGLRGLAIEAPPSGPSYAVGSDAAVRLVIVNSASDPNAKADQLVSITSPAARSWAAYATVADAQSVMSAATAPPSPSSVASTAPAASSSSAGGSASHSAPATTGETIHSGSSASATAPPASTAPQPVTSISIAPGSRVSWGVPDATGALLLVGLKQKLYPGSTIPITFTFANAGAITISVPVQLSSAPNSSVLPVPSASGA